MNESTRTLSYVGAAAVSAVLAFFLAPSNPKAPDEFAEVARPFYPDFAAADATSLTVVSFSDDLREKVFNVELNDKGKWVIGSHKNYPADGKDRLAKTATSVIGIKKEQFATKDPEQYADLQVVDPLDKDSKKLKGRGQRVTLKNASGAVLADYIIGKRVPNRDSYYYVRNPAEKAVYMAKLNVDLSTKFADWIEADLLQLQGENLAEIIINKHSLDKKKGRLVGRETSILKRPKAADPWTLEGLDAAKEEVNQDEVRTMTTALADLKILGVREKPAGLSSDLKSDQGIALDPLTARDLQSKGFHFTQDGQLLSSEGEMNPITDGGVAYTLRFGETFVGTELEMETGLEADQRLKDEKDDKKSTAETKGTNKSRYVFITAHFDESALGPKPEPPGKTPAKKPETRDPFNEKPGEAPADSEKPAPEKPAAEKPAEEKPAPKPGDEKPAPEKPTEEKPEVEKPTEKPEVKPEAKPEETPKTGDCQDETEKKEPAKEDTKKEELKKEESKKEEPAKPEPAKKDAEPAPETKPEAPATKPAETKPAETKPAAGPAAPKGPTPEEQAKADLLAATKKYEQDLKDYNAKVEKGKKKVKELNDRFADWYYVISEENFLKLRLSKASLVKEKTKPEPEPGEAKPGETNPLDPQPSEKPEANPGEKPAEKPAADTEKPKEPAKPDAEKPGEPNPEKKAEEKKAAEANAEDKKPEDKKPE